MAPFRKEKNSFTKLEWVILFSPTESQWIVKKAKVHARNNKLETQRLIDISLGFKNHLAEYSLERDHATEAR